MRHVAREITELLKLFLCRYRLRIRLLCGDLALEFLLGFEHLLELLLGMGVDARVFAAATIHPLQGHFCFVFVSLSFSLNPVLPAFFTPSIPAAPLEEAPVEACAGLSKLPAQCLYPIACRRNCCRAFVRA